MLGAEVGHFLKTVRRPALNITTAECCGLVDRLGPPVAWTRAVAASTDPVALDFHTAKYVLFANSGSRFTIPRIESHPRPSTSGMRQGLEAIFTTKPGSKSCPSISQREAPGRRGARRPGRAGVGRKSPFPHEIAILRVL